MIGFGIFLAAPAVAGGGGPPAFGPSLKFSDRRNSQYALFPIFIW